MLWTALPMLNLPHRPRLLMSAIAFLAFCGAPQYAMAKDGIETAGDVMRVAMPVLAGGYSLIRGDKEGAVELLKSVALASAFAFGMKEAVTSSRPDGSNEDSFPSAHTTNAFSAAAYMDHRYGWKFGLPSYLAAGFVGFSRIHADRNHVADVAVGALIGWGVSHLFVSPLPVTAGAEVSHDGALLRLRAKW